MPLSLVLNKYAKLKPNQIATRCAGREVTHAEQLERVGRLSASLKRFGVEPGDCISVLAMNSDRYLEAILASTWSGAIFNPLNTRWSLSELVAGINDSGARILFVGDEFVHHCKDLVDRCNAIMQIIYMGDGPVPLNMHSFEDLIGCGTFADAVHVSDDAVAGLFYTGGTTGVSRGVKLSHANLLSAVYGSLATGEIVRPGPMLHVAPLFHLAGIWPWLIQLSRGGSHVIMGSFDAEGVCSEVQNQAVTSTLLVPTMIKILCENLQSKNAVLPQLESILYAGSPIPDAVADQLPLLFPNARPCQIYGMTELSPVATLLLPEDHQSTKRRSVGRAALHSDIRIVGEDGDQLGPNEIGEVCVAGPNVMMGYHNRHEETSMSVKGGWMHTGDAGYLDEDGYLFLVDRIKDMIVTGGENVFSIEVENVLMEHPKIADCAVIGLQDERWGERVHAVIVLKKNCELTLEAIQSHASERLARYKIPRSMTLLDSLPVSAAGKVLKRLLRDEYAQ